MKIKNMSKRFISVFLSLMMCVSLLQVPAFAGVEPQYDENGNLIVTETATPEVPETPNVTETPENPETPDVTETPENPETPDVTETPENPETSDVTETPENPEIPDVTETPENPETPDVTETPENPETSDDSETPEDPETPDDSETPEDPEEPSTTTAPDGTITETAPDGTVTVTTPDGTTTVTDPEGNVVSITTTAEDGTIITEYPDGSVTAKLPDGTVSTMDPDGNVTTTYPDGITSDVPPGEEIKTLAEEPSFITDFAALKNAITAANKARNDESVTITLNGNIEVTEVINITSNIIIDLAGCVLNYSGNAKDMIVVGTENDAGSLTIDDSKADGTIQGTAMENIIKVNKKGNLIIEKGTIKSISGERGVYSNGSTTMSGGTITSEGNKAANGGGVFVFGGSFNMTGGSITGNKATNGGGVFVDSGAKFTMSGNASISNNEATNGGGVSVGTRGSSSFEMKGGTITENTATNGGGVSIGDVAASWVTEKTGGSFTMSGGTVDSNTAQNGGGVYVNGGTFAMDKGENESTGTISNNTAAGAVKKNIHSEQYPDWLYSSGGGVYVNGGTFTMNDGTIRGNVAKHNAETTNNEAATNYLNGNRGGGVYIAKNDNSNQKAGTFDMNGGTIEGNKAGEGGGVFLEYAPMNVWTATNKFTMKGGTVDHNDAYIGEGGGIYIRGVGEITKGYITNNKTHTGGDLGGGGIYVESDGELTIINAAIYENLAKGLGGGLAACVHGFTSAIRLDGAAIFDNTSTGAANSVTASEKVDGHSLWQDNKNFKDAAQDIFTASDSAQDTGRDAGAVIGNMMVGGGQSNWTGWNVTNNADSESKYTWTEVTSKNNAYVESDRLLALTSNASEEATKAAKETADVFISGNESLYTHGGGIANNGVLNFGVQGETTQYLQLPTLTVNKTVEGDGLNGWDFSFGMKDEGGNDVDKGNATDKNATATLEFDLKNFDVNKIGDDNTATYTFYVTEDKDGNLQEIASGGTMTYDQSQYKITVTVTKEEVVDENGSNKYKFTSYSFSDPVIVKTHDAEGNEIISDDNTVTDGIMNFVNKYEKPEEPPKEVITEKIFVSPDLKMALEKFFDITGEFAATGTFDFEVYTEENGTKTPLIEDVQIDIADLVSDPNHTQSADFSVDFIGDKEFNGDSFTFYVSEKKGSIDGVTYSDNKYQVTVKVSSTKVTDIVSDILTTITTTYKYDSTTVKIANGTDADGNTIWGDVTGNKITFTNSFKPDEPTTPTNPGGRDPRPPRDPETPPTPTIPDEEVPLGPAPEEPEVSIPDEEVPLAPQPEVPEVTLPEPEVPLAPMPPETTTIPDPEVPLAGVPQTGDGSGAWFALMALAACGLVVLNLRKKENEI